jgi:DNA repair protein RecO (recombination protein O)
MEINKIDGLILRIMPFTETSLIVHILSSAGRSTLLAKGGRRQKSKFAGKLEPLYRINAIVHHKESRSMDILGDVEIIEPHLAIIDDFDKSIYGHAILETVYQLFIEGQPIHREYDEIISNLGQLNSSKEDFIGIFFIFLHQLIVHSGFDIFIHSCRKCGKKEVTKAVFFDLSSGDYICQDCLHKAGEKANMDHLRLMGLRSFAEKKLSPINFDREDKEKILNFYLAYIRQHWKSDFLLKSLDLLKNGMNEV